MTTIAQAGGGFAPLAGLLDRERIIAKAGFNLAGAAGGALHPSLHRNGLWL
jgi:hypothetical protein